MDEYIINNLSCLLYFQYELVISNFIQFLVGKVLKVYFKMLLKKDGFTVRLIGT